MLFYLTNIFLDIVWGSTFWIIKNTSYGIYYLISNNNVEINDISEDDKAIIKLLDETKSQGNQIALLKESIIELKNIIKDPNNHTNEINKDIHEI